MVIVGRTVLFPPNNVLSDVVLLGLSLGPHREFVAADAVNQREGFLYFGRAVVLGHGPEADRAHGPCDRNFF